MGSIRIGTRKSRLALWQAQFVAHMLCKAHPGLKTQLIEITTSGDLFLDQSLAKEGGKGLFLKELEAALHCGEIDIAMHSMKDVTVNLPDGLHISAILSRHDVRDALLGSSASSLDELSAGSVVGTCSLRRQSLIAHHYPHLRVRPLRGNVDTRIAKLDAGEYDAIILAAAGLQRLKLEGRITQYLSEKVFIPAVGQGAIGIESRIDDEQINRLVAPLNHSDTACCIQAERKVNQVLEGGCHMPIAVYAWIQSSCLQLSAFVGLPSGEEVIMANHQANIVDPVLAGEQMAAKLITLGVNDVIERINEPV